MVQGLSRAPPPGSEPRQPLGSPWTPLSLSKGAAQPWWTETPQTFLQGFASLQGSRRGGGEPGKEGKGCFFLSFFLSHIPPSFLLFCPYGGAAPLLGPCLGKWGEMGSSPYPTAGRRRGTTMARSSTSTTTPSRPAGSTPGTGGCRQKKGAGDNHTQFNWGKGSAFPPTTQWCWGGQGPPPRSQLWGRVALVLPPHTYKGGFPT